MSIPAANPDQAKLGAVLRRFVHEGECRECGCHGNSCSVPPDGELCVWTDKMRTLCSNTPCQVAAGKAKRKHKFAARRRAKGRAA